jgi:hypothetical protein
MDTDGELRPARVGLGWSHDKFALGEAVLRDS